MSGDPIDLLTGLPTFQGLSSALDRPTAAIFLDIDGFRSVNDRHGHAAGDALLVRLGSWFAEEAELLRGQVFRVAGDEFIILLRGRTLDEAAAVANRIVSTCSLRTWVGAATADACPGVTLSAVVFFADSELPRRLRAILDEFAEQLYRAELAVGREHSNIVIRRA